MKGSTRLSVFVGFQSHSEFHDLKGVKSLLSSLGRHLLRKHNISLNVQYGKFPLGSTLWNEVTNAIRKSDICIFDISENNPNVMIEVGLALGLDRQVFLLKNKESERFSTPSDLRSFIYVTYPNRKKLNSSEMLSDLSEGFNNFIERAHKPEYLFKRIWGLEDNDSVTVICTELDKPELRMHPEQNEFIYLSKYGDLDALVEVLTTLHRLYRNLRVGLFTGSEVKARRIPYTGNLILIGGPDYNAATRLFNKYVPYAYKRGDGGEHDIYLRDRRDKQVYYPKFARHSGHDEIRDFGFFLKMRNPRNLDKKIIMIGGSHTYGVYGAARAFSYEGDTREGIQYNNCKAVVDKLGFDPEFSSIFGVEGSDQTIDIPVIELRLTRKLTHADPP